MNKHINEAAFNEHWLKEGKTKEWIANRRVEKLANNDTFEFPELNYGEFNEYHRSNGKTQSWINERFEAKKDVGYIFTPATPKKEAIFENPVRYNDLETTYDKNSTVESIPFDSASVITHYTDLDGDDAEIYTEESALVRGQADFPDVKTIGELAKELRSLKDPLEIGVESVTVENPYEQSGANTPLFFRKFINSAGNLIESTYKVEVDQMLGLRDGLFKLPHQNILSDYTMKLGALEVEAVDKLTGGHLQSLRDTWTTYKGDTAGSWFEESIEEDMLYRGVERIKAPDTITNLAHEFTTDAIEGLAQSAPQVLLIMANAPAGATMIIADSQNRAYNDMVENDLDDDIALEFSIPIGVGEGGAEFAGDYAMGKLVGKIPWLKNALVDVVAGLGSEITTELVQLGIGTIGYNAAVDKHNERNGTNLPKRTVTWDEVRETAKQTTLTTIGFGGVGLARRGYQHAKDGNTIKKFKVDTTDKLTKLGYDPEVINSELKGVKNSDDFISALENIDKSMPDNVSPEAFQLDDKGVSVIDKVISWVNSGDVVENQKTDQEYSADVNIINRLHGETSENERGRIVLSTSEQTEQANEEFNQMTNEIKETVENDIKPIKAETTQKLNDIKVEITEKQDEVDTDTKKKVEALPEIQTFESINENRRHDLRKLKADAKADIKRDNHPSNVTLIELLLIQDIETLDLFTKAGKDRVIESNKQVRADKAKILEDAKDKKRKISKSYKGKIETIKNAEKVAIKEVKDKTKTPIKEARDKKNDKIATIRKDGKQQSKNVENSLDKKRVRDLERLGVDRVNKPSSQKSARLDSIRDALESGNLTDIGEKIDNTDGVHQTDSADLNYEEIKTISNYMVENYQNESRAKQVKRLGEIPLSNGELESLSDRQGLILTLAEFNMIDPNILMEATQGNIEAVTAYNNKVKLNNIVDKVNNNTATIEEKEILKDALEKKHKDDAEFDFALKNGRLISDEKTDLDRDIDSMLNYDDSFDRDKSKGRSLVVKLLGLINAGDQLEAISPMLRQKFREYEIKYNKRHNEIVATETYQLFAKLEDARSEAIYLIKKYGKNPKKAKLLENAQTQLSTVEAFEVWFANNGILQTSDIDDHMMKETHEQVDLLFRELGLTENGISFEGFSKFMTDINDIFPDGIPTEYSTPTKSLQNSNTVIPMFSGFAQRVKDQVKDQVKQDVFGTNHKTADQILGWDKDGNPLDTGSRYDVADVDKRAVHKIFDKYIIREEGGSPAWVKWYRLLNLSLVTKSTTAMKQEGDLVKMGQVFIQLGANRMDVLKSVTPSLISNTIKLFNKNYKSVVDVGTTSTDTQELGIDRLSAELEKAGSTRNLKQTGKAILANAKGLKYNENNKAFKALEHFYVDVGMAGVQISDGLMKNTMVGVGNILAKNGAFNNPEFAKNISELTGWTISKTESIINQYQQMLQDDSVTTVPDDVAILIRTITDQLHPNSKLDRPSWLLEGALGDMIMFLKTFAYKEKARIYKNFVLEHNKASMAKDTIVNIDKRLKVIDSILGTLNTELQEFNSIGFGYDHIQTKINKLEDAKNEYNRMRNKAVELKTEADHRKYLNTINMMLNQVVANTLSDVSVNYLRSLSDDDEYDILEDIQESMVGKFLSMFVGIVNLEYFFQNPSSYSLERAISQTTSTIFPKPAKAVFDVLDPNKDLDQKIDSALDAGIYSHGTKSIHYHIQ